jgi:hypothetical protein
MIPDELNTKLDRKDSFFVYYFASDCSHCKRTTPKIGVNEVPSLIRLDSWMEGRVLTKFLR